MDVAGKVVVVTGGGNGIGREVVLEALRRGARVAAVDLREPALEETGRLAAAGERYASFAVDITDRAAVDALPEQVTQALGAPDVVINVAGIIQPFVKVVDLEESAIRRVMEVNLFGTVNVVQAFLPTLIARPSAHLANVASMGAFLPVPGQAIYGASKAGVKLLTEALYAELKGTSVGVTLILPGAVATEITANSGVGVPAAATAVGDTDAAKSFPTTPADVAARRILDGIAKGRLHVYVGRDSRMMNLFSRIAPRRATDLIQFKMKGLLGD
jgi:NAD(P)-dependent dehydrogenase (short-subunit alcohol dehydrogenase family)